MKVSVRKLFIFMAIIITAIFCFTYLFYSQYYLSRTEVLEFSRSFASLVDKSTQLNEDFAKFMVPAGFFQPDTSDYKILEEMRAADANTTTQLERIKGQHKLLQRQAKLLKPTEENKDLIKAFMEYNKACVEVVPAVQEIHSYHIKIWIILKQADINLNSYKKPEPGAKNYTTQYNNYLENRENEIGEVVRQLRNLTPPPEFADWHKELTSLYSESETLATETLQALRVLDFAWLDDIGARGDTLNRKLDEMPDETTVMYEAIDVVFNPIPPRNEDLLNKTRMFIDKAEGTYSKKWVSPNLREALRNAGTNKFF